MAVGVLALQGCIEPHLQMLRQLGEQPVPVRIAEELQGVDRIILPGGESSTMLRLLDRGELFTALQFFGRSKPVWGICAGAILAAERVVHPEQRSLGLIEIEATRNYYGTQLDSFKTSLQIQPLHKAIEVDFIRAPLLRPLNSKVEVLACNGEHPVLLRQGGVLVSAFHTELGADLGLHRFFLEM